MQHILRHHRAALTATVVALIPLPAMSGVAVYENGDEYLKIGGRVQAQYHQADPDGGDTTDELRVRRAWLTFDAAIAEDWKGRLQYQVNGGGSTKDAKIQYTGWSAGTLTVGNFYVPFSREELTSSKRQQLIEKTLVAGTGSPARQLGASLAGGKERFSWEFGLWEAGMATDTSTIAFGSQIDSKQDFEGMLAGGRVEFHPDGDIGFGQGNLAGRSAWEVALNGFSWSNDDDRLNSASDDYDSVTGFGIDGAWRNGPWSVDAEYNVYSAETLGGSVNAGVVENGDADVSTASVEGGYLIVPATWELVAGISSEDADAWADPEMQSGIGVNRFFIGHDAKLQASLVSTTDANGVAGADRTDLYVQMQFAF